MSETTIPDYGGEELETAKPSSDALALLAVHCKDFAKLQIEEAQAVDALKEIKERARIMGTQTIPDLVADLGLAGTIETDNGLKVTIKKIVKGSITEKTRKGALQWFDDNNLSAMVSEDIKLTLKKGSEKTSAAVTAALDKIGVAFTSKKGVHGNTLSAFIRERDMEGEPVPEDLFNIYRSSQAKLG